MLSDALVHQAQEEEKLQAPAASVLAGPLGDLAEDTAEMNLNQPDEEDNIDEQGLGPHPEARR